MQQQPQLQYRVRRQQLQRLRLDTPRALRRCSSSRSYQLRAPTAASFKFAVECCKVSIESLAEGPVRCKSAPTTAEVEPLSAFKRFERTVAAVALSAVLLASGSGSVEVARADALARVPGASSTTSTNNGGGSSSDSRGDEAQAATGAAGVMADYAGLGVDWGSASLSVEAKDDFSEEQARQLVEEVYTVVEANFLDVRNNSFDQEQWAKLKEQALSRSLNGRGSAYNAVREMLKALNDPFTRFLTPLQFAPLSNYDVTGVGLNLGDGPNKEVVVLGIVLESEAFNAGLRQGDIITKVDEQKLAKGDGISAFDVSAMISGPLDTKVRVEAFRPSAEETLKVDLLRKVEPPKTPVSYKLEGETGGGIFSSGGEEMGNRVGYIRLSEFNARAKADVAAAVTDLVENQGATSLVLDLRDNRGGLVTAGVEVAKLFLKDGTLVVSTEGRGGARSRQVCILACIIRANAGRSIPKVLYLCRNLLQKASLQIPH